MPSLGRLAFWEAAALLGGLAGVVLWQIASGVIDLGQLLEGDVRTADGSGFTTEVSPGRVQTMVVTLYVAAYYLAQVLQDPGHFPTLPTEMMYALGGSQVLYLGGKAQARFLGSMKDFLDRRKP